jgi:hypothetical protein
MTIFTYSSPTATSSQKDAAEKYYWKKVNAGEWEYCQFVKVK